MAKFVKAIPGAIGLFEALGFVKIMAAEKEKEEKKEYLFLSDSEVKSESWGELCDVAIQLLNETSEFCEKKEDPAPGSGATTNASKVLCKAGCGFFGDEKTENMCSLCYRKKYSLLTKAEKEKEKEKTKTSPSPAKTAAPSRPCTKLCGFWGQEKFDGMCSACFQKAGGKIDKDGKVTREKARKRWRRAVVKLEAVRRFRMRQGAPGHQQKQKNRCWVCSRKLGISGIECRCGFVFCGKHRYPNEHDCSYDHKQAQRRKLASANPEVKPDKLEKL